MSKAFWENKQIVITKGGRIRISWHPGFLEITPAIFLSIPVDYRTCYEFGFSWFIIGLVFSTKPWPEV